MSTHLDLGYFHNHRLRTENGLQDALAYLTTVLAADDVCIEQLVYDLLSVPNRFAYICTVFAEFPAMRNRITNAFPTNPADLPQSFAKYLLIELSTLFFALPPHAFDEHGLRIVGQYKRYVMDVWPALSVLLDTDFDAINAAIELQKSFKRKTLVSKIPKFNEVPLNNLGVSIPLNADEAKKVATGILSTLKNILHFYFNLLSKDDLADFVRDAYFNNNLHPLSLQTHRSPESHTDVDQSSSTSAIYPQLLKAALQVDGVEGFGQWNIVISSSATKDLKEIKWSDKRRAEFVMNKIFQLSKGRFSGNNQKRLNCPSHGIPVYQAEVLSNLRIVYQIDCIPDDNGMAEHQAIKIYRILDHKELDHIRASLGNHLSKSKEYRKRCTFRKCAPGTNTYIPVSFPRRQADPEHEQTYVAFSDDDLDQMHSPFLLDKFVKFSKAYLNGLIADEEVQLPFQLTAEEWDVVQSRTSCFVIGRSGTGKTTTVLYKMLGIHRAWQETSGCLKPRQMFVTKSRVLRAKVEESFNNLLESLALGRTREELKLRRAQGIRGQEPALIDPMNTLDCRPGTPRRFSELTDDDFPLFITFDHLARLVAADLPHDVSLTCLDDKYSFVKYEDFVNRYWPRLPQRDTKGLAPWLVFSEFMGVIKGSEKALHQPSGCLDKQTYMEMSARAYPNFAYQRETLYKVFEAYCSLKLQECGYDMADRTHSILKLLLSGASLKGRRVDYMYVDEVQDILITDALLLRILCRNPEGLLWAGDTAQTISAGSSFRFQDLKAFMYRTERDEKMGLKMTPTKPLVFQLTANYRSHSGIVNCAQAVVGLIGRFWPNSIDSLRPEQGRTHGLKPIFFSDWEEGIFSPEQFFSGMKEKQIELGAEQCILVRNSAARHRLKEQVGDDALILTLQESKGLEFNDIFLYNFFEDSSAGHSQWSLVLSDCTDCPTFRRDNSQNALLCTELKVLYVGITRARNNLYFLDKSEQGKLMRTFWSSHDLIRRAPAGANIFNYVVSSNPDEWAASGRKLFAASQFNEAARCFRRAGEPHQREFRIAEAFHLREDAKRIFPLSAARSTFLEAGKAFTSCAEETLNFESRMEYYNNAGDCYAQGNDVSGAGASYILAENFVAATRVYYNTERFEDIIQMFERHHVKIRPDYDSILFSVCRRHYYSENVRSPIPLFLSLEEELDYVKKEGFNDAWARLLESCGRNLEAAQVHLCRGQVVKAVQSCLKAQQDEATFQFAVDIALDSLWPRCSFIAIPAKKSFQKTVSDVLEIASNFPSERLSTSECDQLRFFEALCQPSQNEIYQLGCQFLRRGDDFLALAALDRAFSQFPVLNSANLDEMDDYLEQFGTYIHLLISVISDGDPLANRGARRVFGVIELPDHYYGVTKGTFLYDKYNSNRFARTDLNMQLKNRLRTHLCQKVTDESLLCCNPHLSAVSCLPYLVDGICHQKHCNHSHVPRVSEYPGQYNARVSIHLRQICIFQSMHDNCPQEGWNERMRDWLLRLYDAIYPPLYFQGSIADLDLSIIERVSGSCTIVVQKWIEDTFQHLFLGDDFWKYLMEMTRLARLALAFGGRLIVSDSIRITKSSPFYRIPSLRPENLDDHFVIESIVKGLDGAEDDCISHGVSALQHMVRKGVRLDLSTIYDYLEEMCSTLVISSHLHPGGCSSIHDLVVPRKWLANPNKLSGNKDTSSTPAFFAAVRELLDRLRSGKAPKWFALPRNSESFIDITMAKLCRLLCIVGYNSCDAATSERIANILLFSQRVETVESDPHVIRRSEYLSAVRSFDKDTNSEDLVQLIHKENSHTTRPVSPHITFVVYDDVVDIPRIVCRSPDASALLAVQGPYIELTGAELTEDIDDCKWSYPTEEVTAACQIQMAYRLHRIRCASPIPRLPWEAAADKFFMLCLEEVVFSGRKADRYRRVYLNKLPTLLACLEQGLKITYAVRKEASEHLSKESGKKWKDAVDQSTILINEGELLRKILDPQAPLHDRPNIQAFRAAARRISNFIRGIAIGGEGWDKSLQDAVDSVIADL